MNVTEVIQQTGSLGYHVKHWKDLSILKTTDSVSVHALDGLDLKGMIYTTNDDGLAIMVAPGCKVPLDTPSDDPVDHFTPSYDGVLFRIYHHDGAWCVSTTGCINPNVRWGASRSFESLFNDAQYLIDYDFMDQACCYYAILEHEDFVNVVKHIGVKLTLTRVVRMTSTGIQDEPLRLHGSAFANVDTAFADEPEIDPIGSELGQVGYIRHYADGSIYRDNSSQYKRAVTIRPNYPTERERWLYLYINDPDVLEEYMKFFPWTADEHRECAQQIECVKERVCADYLRHCDGERVRYPGRHVRFMQELITELPVDGSGDTDAFLLKQDYRRILFLMDGWKDIQREEKKVEIESQS